MDEAAPPKRCPLCGSLLVGGVSAVLCPVCVLNDDSVGAVEEAAEEIGSLQVGNYLLQEEIARGGMGVVYRARQSGLNRIVALKVLPGAAFSSASFRARFQREAETAASLKHPGIVAVHEVGLALGQPFISMDFIDGPSLATRLAEGRMTPEFAAQILREVACAVSYAHRQGVAHRDLKPSNIVLNPDNHPVLTDFGLACFLDPEVLEGVTLDLMGSPAYLPPERVATGKSSSPVMEDVYGLGAVLYHCLAGRPPFVADSIAELLAAVSESDPVAPRRLNHSVPVDLDTICLKCLEKSPVARYGSASEVADELGRFLRGEPILARPLAPLHWLCRLIRKKPLTVSLIFALFAAILVGSTASLVAWRRAATSAADFRAVAENRRVDLYSANLSAASAAMESGNRNQARELLAWCRPAAGESDLRGYEWFLLERLLRSGERFSTKAHDHILTALAWHPSGDALLSGAHDGSLKSWKRAGEEGLGLDRELVAPGGASIRQLQWLGDGSAFLCAQGAVIRCHRAGETVPLWEIAGTGFSLTADGRTLAVTTGGWFFYEPAGSISLWQMNSNVSQKPEFVRDFGFPARAVAISPDGRWLAAGLPKHGHHDSESDIHWCDLMDSAAAPRHLETSGAILGMTFSPDSSRLVVTTQFAQPRIHAFDVASGTDIVLESPHTARIWVALFAGNSSSLLTASSDRQLCVSSIDGGPAQSLPLAHDNEIWAASIHPSGSKVATGDKDGTLKIHALPLPASPLAAFPRHPHFRYAQPVFSPDSSLVYTCVTSPAWKIVAWNPGETDPHPSPFVFHPTAIDAAGNAAWRDTKKREVIHLSSAQQLSKMDFPAETWPETSSMSNHGASADGRLIYQFSETGHAATADLTTQEIRRLSDFCTVPPIVSALSPGGRFLVAGTWRELIVHDFQTRKTTRLSNDPHWAKAIAFSPDGKLMASGGNDSHILLRRLPDLAIVGKLSGHLSEVSGLVFSPDGHTLVSSEIGSGLRFWRLDTRREVLRIPLPEVCESLVFSPDGHSLAVTTVAPAASPQDGQVLVMPCPRDPLSGASKAADSD